MKKKELEQLEKLNEEKKLTKEVKTKIEKKVFNNFLMALDILLLFIILAVSAKFLHRMQTLILYKISSVVLFVFTLILFEVAYKKDNDEICVHGIEMFVLSVVTLLTPYIFIKRPNIFTEIVGAYFTAYYILKNLVIYKKERKKYIKGKSDITQIIKKESQDELAQEQIEKNKQPEKVKQVKKRGRPKKNNK